MAGFHSRWGHVCLDLQGCPNGRNGCYTTHDARDFGPGCRSLENPSGVYLTGAPEGIGKCSGHNCSKLRRTTLQV